MRINERKNNKAPVMMAPTTLVAANSTARSTTAKRAVPRTAKRSEERAEQAQ